MKQCVQRASARIGRQLREISPGEERDQALQKKYSERWLQVWCFLFGDRDSYHVLQDRGLAFPSDYVIEQLSDRYVHFSRCFLELRDRGLLGGRRNIEFLDAVTLHLLHNIDKSLPALLGWRFRLLGTPACRKGSNHRIQRIMTHLQNKRAGDFEWNYCKELPDLLLG